MMNRDGHRRFTRKSLQETIVVVIVGTLAIGVFLGVVRVMAPDNSSQAENPPQAADAAAPAEEDEPASPPPG